MRSPLCVLVAFVAALWSCSDSTLFIDRVAPRQKVGAFSIDGEAHEAYGDVSFGPERQVCGQEAFRVLVAMAPAEDVDVSMSFVFYTTLPESALDGGGIDVHQHQDMQCQGQTLAQILLLQVSNNGQHYVYEEGDVLLNVRRLDESVYVFSGLVNQARFKSLESDETVEVTASFRHQFIYYRPHSTH